MLQMQEVQVKQRAFKYKGFHVLCVQKSLFILRNKEMERLNNEYTSTSTTRTS
jgi:hypothetical protein